MFIAEILINIVLFSLIGFGLFVFIVLYEEGELWENIGRFVFTGACVFIGWIIISLIILGIFYPAFYN